MSNPARLEAMVSQLRRRMVETGCVFTFTVSSVPEGVEISESDHRHALERLFKDLRQYYAQRRLDLIAEDPRRAAGNYVALEFDTSLARFSPINTFEVGADGSSWLQRLEDAFLDPPYGEVPDAEMFAEFCVVVGLTSGAVALDWVGDPTLEPERSEWSNYFDEGKHMWGIWCATIWNPATRTLAATTASSSD